MNETRRKKSSRPAVVSKTMDSLANMGYDLIEKVESWNPHTRRRHDLFNLADILAVGDQGHCYVQVCLSDVAKHRIKYAEEPLLERLRTLLSCPSTTFAIFSWRREKVKRGGIAIRWVPKIFWARVTEDGVAWVEE